MGKARAMCLKVTRDAERACPSSKLQRSRSGKVYVAQHIDFQKGLAHTVTRQPAR